MRNWISGTTASAVPLHCRSEHGHLRDRRCGTQILRSGTCGTRADTPNDGFEQYGNLIDLPAKPGPILVLEIEAGISIGEIPFRQFFAQRLETRARPQDPDLR